MVECTMDGYTVQIYRSETDGRIVVQIDIPDDEGEVNVDGSPCMRVYLNDDDTYIGTPIGADGEPY